MCVCVDLGVDVFCVCGDVCLRGISPTQPGISQHNFLGVSVCFVFSTFPGALSTDLRSGIFAQVFGQEGPKMNNNLFSFVYLQDTSELCIIILALFQPKMTEKCRDMARL